MADNEGFWARLKHEAEPILIHIFIALLLLGSALIIGIMLQLLEHYLPNQKEQLSHLETADTWLVQVVFWMFIVYTIIILVIRLIRGVVAELPESWFTKAADKEKEPND